MTTAPTLFLVGDSVRGSYQSLLQALFGAQAKVRGPRDNAFDSANTRRRLGEWLGDLQPSVITLNCGLHDIRRNRESGIRQVELEDYRANMDGVITHAKGIKHCSVFVVTTTPVLEDLHQASRDYDRLNADVDAYNAVLCDLADRHGGLPVIDLHSAIAGGPVARFISHDGVHLNDAGRLAAASAVAKILRPRVDEALGLSGWDAQEAAVQNSLSFRLE